MYKPRIQNPTNKKSNKINENRDKPENYPIN
jgi:hypothetical protein